MNLILKIATFSCAGLAALGMIGCKVTQCTETAPDGGTTQKDNCVQIEPTIEYRESTPRTGGQPWSSGHSISITNRNGPLIVALLNGGDERVQFSGTAFTRDTNNADGQARAKATLVNMANPTFSGGDYVTLVAPGGGYDGYDLTVWIPSDFDAALTVETDNGTTRLDGAEGTVSTTVTSHGIIATNMKHSINLHATVGDIDVGGIPSGAGNVVRTDLGDIIARIGVSANLGITAKCEGGAKCDSGMGLTFPADWSQNLAADKKSGAATLGDGSGMLNVSTGLGTVNFYTQ